MLCVDWYDNFKRHRKEVNSMDEIKVVSYKQRRLAFFKEQLAHAERQLGWAMKYGSEYYCAECGEEVSFFRDIVKMLEEQHG